MSSKVLSIMFTDIKGFTERTSAGSREDLVGLLKKHDSLLIPVINKFSGTVIKTIGDAFLVTFDSPTNAVLCGVMIQQNLRDYNAGRPDGEKIFIRVSVNMGEVEVRDGDVFGEAVNIAARLEGVTEASEIFFTESVYLAMNKAEVPSSEVGSFRLKGIPEAIKVYRVIQDTNSENFQKIIERLRGGTFSDVSVPSAGSPFGGGGAKRGIGYGALIIALAVICAGAYAAFFMKTAGRELSRCEEFLNKGDIVQAVLVAEDMLKNYPADIKSVEATLAVLSFEVEAAKKKSDFEKAHKAIDEYRARFKWPQIDAIEKDLLLFEADHFAKNENYRGIEWAYSELENRFAGDPAVLNSIIKNCGAGTKDGPSSRAVHAALKLAETSPYEVALSGQVLQTIIAGLRYNDFRSKTAVRIRSVLKARHAGAEADIRKLTASANLDERANAFMFLKECGKLGEVEEFNYHFGVMTTYNSSSGDHHMRAAVGYFDALAKNGGAAKLKAASAAAGTNLKITSVPILSTSDYLCGSVSVVLRTAFMDEIKESLPVWAADKKDYWLRANAYEMLKAAGELEKLDLWAFHEYSLESFDPSFIPDHFTYAAEYFGGFAKKEKADAAKAVLLKCVEYVRKHKAECEMKNYKDYEARAQQNIEKLEAELAKF